MNKPIRVGPKQRPIIDVNIEVDAPVEADGIFTDEPSDGGIVVSGAILLSFLLA